MTVREAKPASELIMLEMKANGTRKDLDVTQLYLAHRDLQTVESLGCYKLLDELWLNGNKLRHIACLKNNFRIAHLYLQDNELVSISGAICHLSCLKVLMLHNNQLTKLEETVSEMKNMQALHTLNLYHNPLAQENEYRLVVIFNIPSLKLLDRKEVHSSEINEANRLYKPDEQRQMDSIAFGRRCVLQSQLAEVKVNAFTEPIDEDREDDSPQICSQFKTDLQERGAKRSTMQYSYFDWSKVPRAQERRLDQNSSVNKAQIVTVRFR